MRLMILYVANFNFYYIKFNSKIQYMMFIYISIYKHLDSFNGKIYNKKITFYLFSIISYNYCNIYEGIGIVTKIGSAVKNV